MPQPGKLALARAPADDVETKWEVLALPDGLQVPILHHRPPNDTTGPAVLYVHGIESHPGWFIASAQALARAGSEVFQVTRRGSGTCAAPSGHARCYKQLLDDTDAAVEYVIEKTHAEKIALLGVSWGGKLLTAYAIRNPRHICSLTLVTPGLAAKIDLPPLRKLAVLLAWCFHRKKYFAIPLDDVSLFTDNPEMQEYLRNDPHRLRRATAGFLFASAMLDRLIAHARERSIKVPMTLILARRDEIIENSATFDILENLAGRTIRLHWFDSAHTIEFAQDAQTYHQVLCKAVRQGECTDEQNE